MLPYRAAVLQAVESAGVGWAVVNGTTEADWPAVAALARERPWILPSYGLHPWFLKSRTPEWQTRLAELIENGSCALGEIGLDRWIQGYDFEEQKEVFTWQLALAAARNVPATIHCLKAWGALWEILREQPVPERGFLLHSYGGPPEMVEGFVRRGAYFSFSGYFLHARKADQREVFRQIPADRLLVETDAPDMPLPPERARYILPNAPNGTPLNHPANIAAVYEGLAEIRSLTPEALAAQVAENFARLFQ